MTTQTHKTAQRNYAYGIMVNGQKRFGGTIHGESMEEAAINAAKRDGLTIQHREPALRGFDLALVPQAEWVLDGKPASIYVWAPPEYFTDFNCDCIAKTDPNPGNAGERRT